MLHTTRYCSPSRSTSFSTRRRLAGGPDEDAGGEISWEHATYIFIILHVCNQPFFLVYHEINWHFTNQFPEGLRVLGLFWLQSRTKIIGSLKFAMRGHSLTKSYLTSLWNYPNTEVEKCDIPSKRFQQKINIMSQEQQQQQPPQQPPSNYFPIFAFSFPYSILPHLPSWLDPKAPWRLWPLRLPSPCIRCSVDVEKWFWCKALALGPSRWCLGEPWQVPVR